MVGFDRLIGNDDIKNTLGAAIENNEFLHAYIIEGAQGTGKHTVARLAAAAINCQGGCTSHAKCQMCQKIMNDNCTDVRFFDAFKVDDVRKIKETLYESPTECDYKIYILNNVEKMNIKAQNALLISLEEPPKNVVFFLLCTDATILLETIRSRAQTLRTKPLTREEILSYLRDARLPLPNDERLDEIILSSNGSLGYVLDMLSEDKADILIKEREKALDFAKKLLANDAGAATHLTSMFNMTRERLKDLFSLTLVVLRDLAVVKRTKNAPLCFFTSSKDAYLVASGYSLQKILNLYNALESGIESLNINANVPSTLVSLLNYKTKGE